jgi:hypothetical protein
LKEYNEVREGLARRYEVSRVEKESLSVLQPTESVPIGSIQGRGMEMHSKEKGVAGHTSRAVAVLDRAARLPVRARMAWRANTLTSHTAGLCFFRFVSRGAGRANEMGRCICARVWISSVNPSAASSPLSLTRPGRAAVQWWMADRDVELRVIINYRIIMTKVPYALTLSYIIVT